MPALTLSLFGLVVTLGLVTYDTRNDQLYNKLVSRASTIERNLGLPDGSFANRPQASLAVKFREKKCKYRREYDLQGVRRSLAFRRLRFNPGVSSSGLIPELARLAYLGLGFWLPQRLSEKTLRSG